MFSIEMHKNIVTKLVLGLFFTFALTGIHTAYAGIQNEANIKNRLKVNTNRDAYLIQIAAPNEQGVSYNKFVDFNQNGKTLVLVNSPQLNPNLKSNSARTIIIELADGKVANISNINVEGRSGDLVILAPGGVTCQGCEISNVERVTIATGTPGFKSGTLDKINIRKGKLNIARKGLTASQSSIIDLIAKDVLIDGPVVTNMRGRIVTKGNTKTKIIDSAGPLSVANGDMQIMAGRNVYNYPTRQSDPVYTNQSGASIHLTSKGDIETGFLHMESTGHHGDIIIDSVIKAQGAWTYVGRYQDKTIVPAESVTVRGNGAVYVNSQVVAGNKVSLESTENIYVTPPGGIEKYEVESIRASDVDIAAVNSVLNTGAIVSENVSIAAKEFINEGDVEAADDVFISGKHGIKNQFGGVIIGENVFLKSIMNIYNGSIYPFRLVPKGNGAVLKSLSHLTEIKAGGKTSVPPIPSDKRSQRVSTLEAFILGQNVKIEANELINANPYMISRKNIRQQQFFLDPNKSDQVIISAETNLNIQLNHRFWNMSAIVESWTGNMILNAPIIDNERYYIWADTYDVDCPYAIIRENGLKSCLKIALPPLYINGTEVHGIIQYLKALSPPAKIHVGGSAVFNAYDLNNEYSAVEIRGDVHGRVKNVWMLGLKLREIEEKTIITPHSRRYCTRRIFGHCYRRRTERWTTSRIELAKNDTVDEYPYIFYVDGHVNRGFGSYSTIMQDLTFGPYASAYTPKPKVIEKPAKYIPIINNGITFFIPNPDYQKWLLIKKIRQRMF